MLLRRHRSRRGALGLPRRVHRRRSSWAGRGQPTGQRSHSPAQRAEQTARQQPSPLPLTHSGALAATIPGSPARGRRQNTSARTGAATAPATQQLTHRQARPIESPRRASDLSQVQANQKMAGFEPRRKKDIGSNPAILRLSRTWCRSRASPPPTARSDGQAVGMERPARPPSTAAAAAALGGGERGIIGVSASKRIVASMTLQNHSESRARVGKSSTKDG